MRSSSPLVVSCLIITALLACCHKAPPSKTGKAKRDESTLRQTTEREAVESFANAVREVIEWRHSQPVQQEPAAHALAVNEFVKRMQSVPTGGLPADVLEAWEALEDTAGKLGAALSSSSPPKAEELKKLENEGKKAGEILNRWLDRQGFGELHF